MTPTGAVGATSVLYMRTGMLPSPEDPRDFVAEDVFAFEHQQIALGTSSISGLSRQGPGMAKGHSLTPRPLPYAWTAFDPPDALRLIAGNGVLHQLNAPMCIPCAGVTLLEWQVANQHELTLPTKQAKSAKPVRIQQAHANTSILPSSTSMLPDAVPHLKESAEVTGATIDASAGIAADQTVSSSSVSIPTAIATPPSSSSSASLSNPSSSPSSSPNSCHPSDALFPGGGGRGALAPHSLVISLSTEYVYAQRTNSQTPGMTAADCMRILVRGVPTARSYSRWIQAKAEYHSARELENSKATFLAQVGQLQVPKTDPTAVDVAQSLQALETNVSRWSAKTTAAVHRLERKVTREIAASQGGAIYARVNSLKGLKLALNHNGVCVLVLPLYPDEGNGTSNDNGIGRVADNGGLSMTSFVHGAAVPSLSFPITLGRSRRLDFWRPPVPTGGGGGGGPAASTSSIPPAGHAVAIVGYDDSRRILLLRNSWGEQWGDQGHCWMPYDDFGLAWECWTLFHQGKSLGYYNAVRNRQLVILKTPTPPDQAASPIPLAPSAASGAAPGPGGSRVSANGTRLAENKENGTDRQSIPAPTKDAKEAKFQPGGVQSHLQHAHLQDRTRTLGAGWSGSSVNGDQGSGGSRGPGSSVVPRQSPLPISAPLRVQPTSTSLNSHTPGHRLSDGGSATVAPVGPVGLVGPIGTKVCPQGLPPKTVGHMANGTLYPRGGRPGLPTPVPSGRFKLH